MSSKADRRKFLKYVGAGLVAATAAGAGYYLYSKQPGYARTQTVTIPEGSETTSTNLATSTKQNHPPVASFKSRAYYLNPTDQQTIQFTNYSYDPDGDPLKYTWLVDEQTVSQEKDYSTKLPVGQHRIKLRVADSQNEDVAGHMVDVDPDQIYPAKPLHLKYKGVNYCVGKPMNPEWSTDYPSPNRDQIDEELDNIHNDLGCNAMIITAGADSEDDLIECARTALQKGFFDRIYVEPHYWQHSTDETVERIARFAPRVRALREASEVIHFMVGHEFSLETHGIVPGDTWSDRVEYQVKNPNWADKVWATFPRMFKDIIAACKENYGYKISYAAISYAEIDAVPWADPMFESVGIDGGLLPALGVTEEVLFRQLSELKGKFGKPIITPDGPSCMTYTGADQWDGAILPHASENRPYDEDAQAKYIKSYCDVLNRAGIEGCFYWQYRENYDVAVGLYGGGKKRKKGFYMYKSYQLHA